MVTIQFKYTLFTKYGISQKKNVFIMTEKLNSVHLFFFLFEFAHRHRVTTAQREKISYNYSENI